MSISNRLHAPTNSVTLDFIGLVAALQRLDNGLANPRPNSRPQPLRECANNGEGLGRCAVVFEFAVPDCSASAHISKSLSEKITNR